MKIVTKRQFLELPAGTLFSYYEPCWFRDFMIKGESLPNDFFYTSVLDAVDLLEVESAEYSGASVSMDFDALDREGLYDNALLYAVWERTDVEALARKLQGILEGSN